MRVVTINSGFSLPGLNTSSWKDSVTIRLFSTHYDRGCLVRLSSYTCTFTSLYLDHIITEMVNDIPVTRLVTIGCDSDLHAIGNSKQNVCHDVK